MDTSWTPLRTLHALVLIFSTSLIVGCAMPATQDVAPLEPSDTFKGQFEEIWRAVQKSLAHYPIAINNIDEGLIETDWIRAEQAWAAPYEKKGENPTGRYKIRVNALRGVVGDKDSVLVKIEKKITKQKDFFSDQKELSSDGMEETTILYRIRREIELERSMRRAFERGNI